MGHEAGHPLKPFASQSVVMLNVLQAPRSSQPFPYEVRVALVLGALLALVFMVIQDRQASDLLAVQHLEKEKLQLQLQLQTNHQDSNQKPAALRQLQQSIREQQQWLDALQAHQQMRDDLMAVQEVLFTRRLESNASLVQMQQLLWQEGSLEWEGSSSTPAAIQGMLRHLSQFPHWRNAPGLVQVQALSGSVLVSASSPPDQAVPSAPFKHVFKLTGGLTSAWPQAPAIEVKP